MGSIPQLLETKRRLVALLILPNLIRMVVQEAVSCESQPLHDLFRCVTEPKNTQQMAI